MTKEEREIPENADEQTWFVATCECEAGAGNRVSGRADTGSVIQSIEHRLAREAALEEAGKARLSGGLQALCGVMRQLRPGAEGEKQVSG